jgi:sugar lactone lactonase YvrE
MLPLCITVLLSYGYPDGADEPGSEQTTAGYILVEGYRAFVFADGLISPDGLAFSPDGVLYVAEEGAGRISAITGEGSRETVLDRIDCPEGLCFDADGNLYIAQDLEKGSILRLTPDGILTQIADATAPEGIAIASDGCLYFTQSSVQLVSNPLDLWTAVSRVSGSSGVEQVCLMRYVFSFSGIAIDSSGIVYFANELSPGGSGPSILMLDPEGGSPDIFCTEPGFCEGLSFQPGGLFPLLVTQEGTGGRGGILWEVYPDGSASVLASGFRSLEDVAVGGDGSIYVSDDASGTVIVLIPGDSQLFSDL